MIATAEKVHCFRPPQVKVPAEFPPPYSSSSYFVFIVLLVESFFKELWLTNIGKQR